MGIRGDGLLAEKRAGEMLNNNTIIHHNMLRVSGLQSANGGPPGMRAETEMNELPTDPPTSLSKSTEEHLSGVNNTWLLLLWAECG